VGVLPEPAVGVFTQLSGSGEGPGTGRALPGCRKQAGRWRPGPGRHAVIGRDSAGGRSPCHLHALCIAPAPVRVAVLGDKGYSSLGGIGGMVRLWQAAAFPSQGNGWGVANGRYQKPRYAYLRRLECARS
jgi:hypothetical protein